MKRITLILSAILLGALAGASQTTGMSYEQLEAKAERFFQGGEWGTAGAIYGIMLDQRGNTPQIYGRAIVAAEMQADTARVEQLMRQSMNHGVAFDSTFGAVQQSALDVGDGTLYPTFLMQARNMYPYLSRQINAHLLRYYTQHNDGNAVVDYARRMLEGIPDNVTYLDLLARGYMLQDNMPAAVDTWQHILRVEPDNVNALLYLGNYYLQTSDKTAALPYLRRANELKPSPYVESLLKQSEQEHPHK